MFVVSRLPTHMRYWLNLYPVRYRQDTLPYNLYWTPDAPVLPVAVPGPPERPASTSPAPDSGAGGSGEPDNDKDDGPEPPVPQGYRLVRSGVVLGSERVPEGAEHYNGTQDYLRRGPTVNFVGRWAGTASGLLSSLKGLRPPELGEGGRRRYGRRALSWAILPLSELPGLVSSPKCISCLQLC